MIELLAVLQLQTSGSFTKAAAELGLTPSALSKAIDRLERRLGVRLFERSTRRVSTTAEGERFADYARRAVEEVAAAEDEIGLGQAMPRGILRINVGTAFANHQLLPALPRFLERYPDVSLEITVTDRLADLSHEGYDLAIRTGSIGTQLDLVAHHVTDLQRLVCAAPSYLVRAGTPEHPAQLAQHQCIAINSPLVANHTWPFLVEGQVQQFAVSARIKVDSAESVLSLGIAGAGIVRLSDFMVTAALEAGLLVPVLGAFLAPDTLPLTALYPHGRRRQAKVAAMLGFLDEEFGRGD